MNVKSFSLAVLLVGGSQLSLAGISAGFTAYAKADYSTALKEFQAAAEKGDARAQAKLGKMFASARGVPRDSAQAEKWYRLAAAQGNPIAQYELGRDLVLGIDGREAEGLKMLEASAEQNNILAMELLGALYASGRRVPQDSKEALKWYSSASARGSKYAQQQIALLAAKPGIEHGLALFNTYDYFSAMSELTPWAEMGDSSAQYAVGAMYGTGDGQGLVRANPELARKWIELSAAQNNGDALLWLARNVEKDEIKIPGLLRRSADQGNFFAMFWLGSAFEFGRYGLEKDYDTAMLWYINAANTGNAEMQFGVGDKYAEGKIVPIDLAEAAKWYEVAANKGFFPALVKLGDLYAQGVGVSKNKALAAEWYLKAIDSDIIEAHRGLAQLLGE